MINHFTHRYLLLSLCIFLTTQVFAVNDPPSKTPPPLLSQRFGWDFEDLFDESDLFTERSTFVWANYQAFSTRGSRDDKTGTIIPAVGLHFERQVFYNLGIRLGANLHVWEEEKILVESFSQSFTETFEYRYWTVAVGGTWHFTLDSNWDPYLGIQASYRHSSAACDCVEGSSNTTSFDLLIGTRYFMADRFYLSAEVGQHGVGYLQLGLGFKIG
jgi:hypothetical protein